jgi:hypothetical protein
VIVVPALAHSEQRRERNVAALRSGAVHHMVHAAVVVGEVTDEPVPKHASRDAGASAPEHKAPAIKGEQDPRRRELLQHLRAFHKPVEVVARNSRLYLDRRLTFKPQLAVQLPPGVAPEAAAMAKVVMAVGQALGVLAQFVLAKEAKRASQPDLHTAVNEDVLEPPGRLEAVVDR